MAVVLIATAALFSQPLSDPRRTDRAVRFLLGLAARATDFSSRVHDATPAR